MPLSPKASVKSLEENYNAWRFQKIHIVYLLIHILNEENNLTHYYFYSSQKSLIMCRKREDSVTGINNASNMNLLVKLKMNETT